jgi:glycosyltransferase involved in cell wall biosynthesis
MNPPLVSILIPCHNAAPWLAQTLESALGQTWPHQEIIVVDDGSSDSSQAIARGFEARGVKVVVQANRGAATARNHALQHAQGEFIQFLDADDLISPDKISAQANLLATRPPGTVASCAWGRFTDDPEMATFVDDEVCHDFAPIDFLILAAGTGAMMHPSAWLVPRAVAERAGPWDESLTLNDDGEYFCRVLLASQGLAFTPGARSYYRSGLPGSLSRRRDERSRQSLFHSLERIEQSLRAHEDSPRARRAAANHYQRFLHEFFPFPRELMHVARQRIIALGGADFSKPAMGPRTAALARFVGWKNVWRIKYWLCRR